MKKIWLFLLLFLLIPIQSYSYTMYYDCGTCDILTPVSNTSGLQTLGANSGWSYQTFGSSVQSRTVDGVIARTTGYDQTVMIVAGVHGDDETTTTRAALNFLDYLAANPTHYPTTRFIVIPMVNPDGRVAATRRNIGAAGYPVNLNRNFPNGWGAATGCGVANAGSAVLSSSDYKGPSAGSEPETQAIISAVDTYSPDVFMDWHMNSNNVIRTGVDTNSWKYTQITAGIVADGFTGFGANYYCYDFGCASTYALSLGKESFMIEGGTGGVTPTADGGVAVKEQVNRMISAAKAFLDHRRYFNSSAIRMTSSAATKIGDVTYASGVLSSIAITPTTTGQSLEITGYKSPFVEATKTTINLATSTSTPTFGADATTLTGVPLTISAASGSLDIVVSAWTASSKVWTESTTSGPTNPVHVISGLTSGQSYRVAVTNALQSTITGAACSVSNGYNWCTADAQGKVTFTYGGTYSDHEFTVDQEEGGMISPVISGGRLTGGVIK